MLVATRFGAAIHSIPDYKIHGINHNNTIEMTTLFETIAQSTRPVKIIPIKVSTCDFCGEKTITEVHDYEGFVICHKCYNRYGQKRNNS